MASIGTGIRQSLRLLARRPGFSSVVILTLAIGIDANAAIFSVAHSFLVRPLPYGDPRGLFYGVAPADPAAFAASIATLREE